MFLLSRRWTLFLLAVIALAYLAWSLGQWQFHRLDDRKAANALVGKNLAASPVPVDELLSTGQQPAPSDEYRQVTLTGTWEQDSTVVVKYRTRKSAPGVNIVTPLIAEDGKAVWVDRGWMGSANSGNKRPEIPDASAGVVTVAGWIRRDAEGSSAKVTDLATRSISSLEMAAATGLDSYQGFVEMQSQDPQSSAELSPAAPPDHSGNGPHFFYGLQWWFFGALAVFGFFYLIYDEWKRSRSEHPTSRPQPSGPVDRSDDLEAAK